MRHTETSKTYDSAGVLVETRTVEWDTTPEQDNENILRIRADAALADLHTISNTNGALSTAQLSNAVRVLARVASALIRLTIRRLDATD